MGEINAFFVLTGKPVGKNSLKRLRLRWKDCVKIDFIGTGYDVERIQLPRSRIQL
jgi:hypothetical protein